MLVLFKKTAAFHSVRQISLIALPPLRFPAFSSESASSTGATGTLVITLYFIIPRTQLTENRTTLDLPIFISPDLSTNSIVKVFIEQERY